MKTSPKVYWSKHALERIRERFGNERWRVVPYKQIARAGSLRKTGEQFNVRSGKAFYGCVVTDKGILVMTVMRIPRKQGR